MVWSSNSMNVFFFSLKWGVCIHLHTVMQLAFLKSQLINSKYDNYISQIYTIIHLVWGWRTMSGCASGRSRNSEGRGSTQLELWTHVNDKSNNEILRNYPYIWDWNGGVRISWTLPLCKTQTSYLNFANNITTGLVMIIISS